MRIDILTLFPDAVEASLKISILGRAEKKGILDIHAVQIRDYTENKQQQVDDYPYGGGWGQVMMAQPLKSCLDDVCAKAGEKRRRVIYMSPQGKTFDQSCARRLAADYDHLVLVCGHYEGVDERFIEACVDEELSIGDFVLTGGEIHVGDEVTLLPALENPPLRAAVITLSDKGSRGEREDKSGPLIVEMLTAAGYVVEETMILPDEAKALKAQGKEACSLLYKPDLLWNPVRYACVLEQLRRQFKKFKTYYPVHK